MQINGQNGLQIIDAYGAVSHSSQWRIDLPEEEAAFGACGGSSSFRIAGTNHIISRMSIGLCPSSTIQWDASSSTVNGFGTGNYVVTFNLTGNMNSFYWPEGGDLLGADVTMNSSGFGNTLSASDEFNPFAGVQPAQRQYAPPSLNGFGTTPLGNTTVSRGAVSLNRTKDFLDQGGSVYFFNSEDLWMWPQAMHDTAGGGTSNPILTADVTSESGYYFQVNTSGRTNQYVSMLNGNSLYIGSQIPPGKIRIYFKAKAASATNITVSAAAGGTGIGSTTASLTTSYAVYSFDADATSYSGQMFILNFAAVTANAKIAWIGIRPWNTDGTFTSLTLGSGTAMTGNQGNGTKIQHSTGSLTSQNCLKSDANGNTADAGAPCATVTTSRTCNANGCYRVEGDGTIEAWGQTGAASSGTTATLTATFPTTFTTTTNLEITVFPVGTPTGDGNPHPLDCHLVSDTTGGLTAIIALPVQVGGGGYTALNSSNYCSYHVLGN